MNFGLVFIVMNKANLTMDSQINIYQKAYEALRFSMHAHGNNLGYLPIIHTMHHTNFQRKTL